MAHQPAHRGADARPRIDVHQEQALREWSKKLDATPEQLREAVEAVGDGADDVEMHLKGSRSSSNSDRMAGKAS
ncbi:DUF3606 domain-containing protein [Aquabacterium sp. A7-Y]|uniref:DUF3606 domain-containing protein n=1 Tax=Aquabacterium sp. A7-Y TaxID=1349605 RepID=UPI00223DA8BB|nr:DUF3606 domain-containing protein [Aquabacterium sp. A7-Y]MCW7537143.1 DUF3606 domain-containing protein [Aquabacterium sp. A7-Y]